MVTKDLASAGSSVVDGAHERDAVGEAPLGAIDRVARRTRAALRREGQHSQPGLAADGGPSTGRAPGNRGEPSHGPPRPVASSPWRTKSVKRSGTKVTGSTSEE